jgi:hypothetical protein
MKQHYSVLLNEMIFGSVPDLVAFGTEFSRDGDTVILTLEEATTPRGLANAKVTVTDVSDTSASGGQRRSRRSLHHDRNRRRDSSR